jgi:tetratricopeptide (TPR) repeat protein
MTKERIFLDASIRNILYHRPEVRDLSLSGRRTHHYFVANIPWYIKAVVGQCRCGYPCFGRKDEKHLQNKAHLTELKKTQEREKELLQKVAQLEEENRKLSASKQSSEKLKEQFQQASQGLTAVDWVNKASALWAEGKYIDPQKAIKYLNSAIKLQSDYAEAYYNRGLAYYNLDQYQRAIEDYNEAIRLQPDLAEAYCNRGNAYKNLGHNQRAIEDYNEAIRLQPDLAAAYYNKGNAYYNLDQYQRAIEDYNEAIRLQPDYAEPYYNRGIAYNNLGQNQRAIEDYNEAIRLKPNLAKT